MHECSARGKEGEHIFPLVVSPKLWSCFLPVSVDFRWMDELIHEKTEEDFLTPSLPHFPLSQSVRALNTPAC